MVFWKISQTSIFWLYFFISLVELKGGGFPSVYILGRARTHRVNTLSSVVMYTPDAMCIFGGDCDKHIKPWNRFKKNSPSDDSYNVFSQSNIHSYHQLW